MENTTLFLILAGGFGAGSLFNFKRRHQSIFSVSLTKPRAVIVILSALIFFGIVYFIGGNHWMNYLLAAAAGIFLLSGVLAEGIHEEGIVYYQGRGLPPVIKWENIINVTVKKSNHAVVTFIDNRPIAKKTGMGGKEKKQYYSLEDFEEIQGYIEKRCSDSNNE